MWFGRAPTGRDTEVTMTRTRKLTIPLALLSLTLGGCGYNRLVTLREAIDGAWVSWRRPSTR